MTSAEKRIRLVYDDVSIYMKELDKAIAGVSKSGRPDFKDYSFETAVWHAYDKFASALERDNVQREDIPGFDTSLAEFVEWASQLTCIEHFSEELDQEDLYRFARHITEDFRANYSNLFESRQDK